MRNSSENGMLEENRKQVAFVEANVYILLTFVGVWMLYIFPLYQGIEELSEQKRVLRKFSVGGKKYPQVSPWWWLLPPVKISKEKQRGIKILKDNFSEEEDVRALFHFFNKTTGWFYIAIAGLLNGIVATAELAAALPFTVPLVGQLAVDLVIIVSGLLHARYRVSRRREQRLIEQLAGRRK